MNTLVEHKVRYVQLLFGQQAFALWAMCIGVGLHAFNWYMVCTLTPTISIEFGEVTLISWITTIYLIFSIVFGIYAGYLKKQIGSRYVMMGSAFVFAIGSLIVTVAPSMEIVLFGRAIQGIGEGVILAMSYGAVQELFTTKLLPSIYGLFAFVFAFSAALGPVLAGMLTDLFSWRVTISVNILISAIYIGLVYRSIPNKLMSGESRSTSIPIFRLFLVGLSITAVGLTSNFDSWDVKISVLLGISVLLLVVFVLIDRQCKDKLLPIHSFSLFSASGVGFWVILLLPLPVSSLHVFVPLLGQIQYSLPVSQAGYLATVIAFMWSLFALIVGRFDGDKYGYIFIFAGITVYFLGFFVFFIGFNQHQLILLIISLALIGAAFGGSWAFISQKIVEYTEKSEGDLAASLIPVVQSVALAIGAGLAGLGANMNGLTSNQVVETIDDALSPVFLSSLILSAIAYFITLFFLFKLKRLN